jgi:type IV pilus assembly protein PilP
MRKRNSLLLALSLVLALLLPGCSKPAEPPKSPEPKPSAPPPAQPGAPAAAVQKPMSSAAQQPSGLDFSRRIDPFKPYAPVVAPAPAQGQPKSAEQSAARPAADALPIQSFETGRFKVSGIIAGLRENRALLIDPNGKGYVVQEGMQIGMNNGRISRITAHSVEVMESFRDDKGKPRKRTIVLTLAKKR